MLARRAALALLLLPATAAATPEIYERLRRGGLVLLMRHARTDPGTGDPPNFRLDDCSTQRNLDAAGRRQAQAIGDRLRAERVPVDRILTSRWCRCRETAELLGLGTVEPAPAIDSFFEDRVRRDEQTRAARELAAAWTGPGNLVMVTHQVNVTALTSVFPASGAAVVTTPSLEVLGRLPPP